MIYLDNAASTMVDPRVVDAMVPYFGQMYGNPSSIHRHGRTALRAVRQARGQVADLVGAKPSEILLTSGATESNNTVLLAMNDSTDCHTITTAIEHDAVLEPCRRLERRGVCISYLSVDPDGLVDLDALESKISRQTRLVSVMLANNEVGTIQPIKKISKICHDHGVLLHTDAVQAVGKMPVDVNELGADFMSISSHKIGGPKGVGALFVREGLQLAPLILGGGQERGLRSGTENVAGIVGFGHACMLCMEGMKQNIMHYRRLSQRLVSGIMSSISHCKLNGSGSMRIPNNVNVTFLGIQGEDLIIKLDEYGVAASTGSACSVNVQKASHVLQAMGLSRDEISGSLRLTLGTNNTESEIDRAIELIKKAVFELRAVSPLRQKYGL